MYDASRVKVLEPYWVADNNDNSNYTISKGSQPTLLGHVEHTLVQKYLPNIYRGSGLNESCTGVGGRYSSHDG